MNQIINHEAAAEILESADRLYSQNEVEQALDRMSVEIASRLSASDPIVLCVLHGALIPAGQLLTRLHFPLRQDYVHATRYRGQTSGAELKWIGKPTIGLEGETILIIDDILDEGITISAIADACLAAGAKTVLTAVLVEKIHQRGNGFKADFTGLAVEDRYIFGFGMDYKGYLRNAPGIFALPKD